MNRLTKIFAPGGGPHPPHATCTAFAEGNGVRGSTRLAPESATPTIRGRWPGEAVVFLHGPIGGRGRRRWHGVDSRPPLFGA